jgi:hypothetical protein
MAVSGMGSRIEKRKCIAHGGMMSSLYRGIEELRWLYRWAKAA